MLLKLPRYFGVFALIALLVLTVQLVKIDRPYFGHFSSYQNVVIASISRNMLRENFSDLFRPKTDLVIDGRRSLNLIYYPLPSLLAAMVVKTVGGSLEFWGRFQAIFFNFMSVGLMGLLGARLFRRRIGSIAMTLFALSPMSLIYGQSFMLESLALFFLLLSFTCLSFLDSKNPKTWLVLLAGLCFSVAATERVHYIFVYPAALLYLFTTLNSKRFSSIFLFSLAAVSLPIVWHVYAFLISRHTTNILAVLLTQFGYFKVGDKSYLTDPDYYRRLFDIVSGVMLTPLFFPFLLLGAFLMPWRSKSAWLVASAILCGSVIAIISPLKIIEQDFYLYGIFPFMVFMTAWGVSAVFDMKPQLKRTLWIVLALLIYFIISARFFLHPIYQYPKADNDILRIALKLQQTTTPTDMIIIAGEAPVDMVYYADRMAFELPFRAIGKIPDQFIAHPRATGFNAQMLDELTRAQQNPVSFFEYFRKQGATYFLAYRRHELEGQKELFAYLTTRFTRISSNQDDFYLFHLAPREN